MKRPSRPLFTEIPLSEAGLGDIDRAQQDRSGYIKHDLMKERHRREQGKAWKNAESTGSSAYLAFLRELQDAVGNAFNGYTGVKVGPDDYNPYGTYITVTGFDSSNKKYPVEIAVVHIPGAFPGSMSASTGRPDYPWLNIRNAGRVVRRLQISPRATAADVAKMIKDHTRQFAPKTGASVDADANKVAARYLDVPVDYDRTARRAKERGIGVGEAREDIPGYSQTVSYFKSSGGRRGSKQIRVGDEVIGIMGVDGGYVGTVTRVTTENHGGRPREVVFFKGPDGKERDTLAFNLVKLDTPEGQRELKFHRGGKNAQNREPVRDEAGPTS